MIGKDIMIDIETLGLMNSSVILQVGYTLFDADIPATEQQMHTHHQRLGIHEQLQAGRTVCASTLMWWMQRPEELRKRVFLEKQETEGEIANFLSLLVTRAHNAERVWAHGTTFDITMLTSLWNQVGDDREFAPYHNIRDTRGLFEMFPPTWPERTEEQKHDAGSDAWAQAVAVCSSYQEYKEFEQWLKNKK